VALISQKPIEGNFYEYKSPLLFETLARINQAEFYHLLDIGSANSSSIEFLNDYQCKIHICHCIDDLLNLTLEDLNTPNKLNRAFVKALGLYKNHNNKIGIIMLWDLPNYLQPEILQGLIKFLMQHIHDKAIIHTYIHTTRLMPAIPGNYAIEKSGKVAMQNNLDSSTDCPAYYQEELHKHMSPFRVRRSVLQANGIQEYLLSIN